MISRSALSTSALITSDNKYCKIIYIIYNEISLEIFIYHMLYNKYSLSLLK